MSGRRHLPSGRVTFLFTDIEGSTRLARMLGDGYRPVLTEHRRLMRAVLAETDGAELFTEGDSFFVAFPDASAALYACVAAQHVLAAHDWPSPSARPLVRMGLHTGYAEPVGGEYTSQEVHRAARVAAAAHGGQIICSAATMRAAGDDVPYQLVDLGLHRLRGFDDAERLYQVVAPGLERDFPRPRTSGASPHNLPSAATTFVGRLGEQTELRELMASYRLVTVTGTGGAGKTRLAVEVAADQVEEYPDGVWFVDLAAVNDPCLVAGTIAAPLGLRPEPGRRMTDTLVEHLANRRCLLILDTCDHQLEATAPMVTRLLSGAPHMRILCTSREPFGLPGEVVWRIPPLSTKVPPSGGPSDAVELLLVRAAAARGGRRADAQEMSQLNRIANRLGGLPLALELAAARLRVLSAAQLAERLDDVLGTLDAGHRPSEDRHATLHATVDWSYRTLGPRAGRLLRWMSVFAGPVELPTVEWLLGTDPLDPLAVLVDKSLVQVEPTATGSTYRMLDPIRAWAAKRLADDGEDREARERHLAWCLDAVERAGRGPDGRPVTLSLYPLDPVADELRAALGWAAADGSARAGLRLASAQDQWWRERGLAREARLWLSRLYDRLGVTGEHVPDAELAHIYHVHALYAGADGEVADELRYVRLAVQAATRAGDPGLLARVRSAGAGSLAAMGRVAEAEAECRSIIADARRARVEADALFAIYSLARLLWQRGALAEAADLLAGARPLEASRPEVRGRRTLDMYLGLIALSRRDLVAAHEYLGVALRYRIGYGFGSRALETLDAMAVRCAVGGDHVTAARLSGAVEAASRRLHCRPNTFSAYFSEQLGAVREALGDAAFDTHYADGMGLSFDEATALALAIEHPDMAANSPRFDEVAS